MIGSEPRRDVFVVRSRVKLLHTRRLPKSRLVSEIQPSRSYPLQDFRLQRPKGFAELFEKVLRTDVEFGRARSINIGDQKKSYRDDKRQHKKASFLAALPPRDRKPDGPFKPENPMATMSRRTATGSRFQRRPGCSPAN